MKTGSCQVFVSLLAAGVMAAMTSEAAAQDWWIKAGPVVRGGMKVKVAGPTYVQALRLFQPTTAPAAAPRDGIGSISDYADRAYDNGYVNKAPSTGVSPIDRNTTWNWGYNDGAANHYNAANQTLSFQKSYLPTSTRSDDDMLAAGLHLLAGVSLCKSEKWTVDLAFGFQAVWGSATPSLGAQQLTVNDVYDVSATVADGFTFSEPAHHGTFNGPFDDPPAPGTIIPNKPVPALSSQSIAVNRAAFHVDQGLYQINLGPQFGYAASSRLRLNLRPTVSLNVMDVDVQRSETFVRTTTGGGSVQLVFPAPGSEHNDKTKVAFGLGVTGGADWDLGKGYYIGVFGGYEWITDKVKVAVGLNTVSLDGSGFVAGAVLGKKF